MPDQGTPDLKRAVVFEATRGEKEKVAVLAIWTEDQPAANLEVILSPQQARVLAQALRKAVDNTQIGHA